MRKHHGRVAPMAYNDIARDISESYSFKELLYGPGVKNNKQMKMVFVYLTCNLVLQGTFTDLYAYVENHFFRSVPVG